jgi:hypothetical protein
MEDKKTKNILVLMTPFDSNVPSFYELIKDLISLGHNVTCYVVDKLESKIKPTGAKLKIYSIDLNGMNKIPPAIRYRTYTPYSISLFYDAVLNDVTKSEEKYDYLIVDSFIDGNEINKIIKAKTVVSLYLNCLGQKTPFVELNLLHRKHYWININKKYNLNIKDFLIQHFSPDAKYKLMFTSKLFHPELKIIDDSFYFIGPGFDERPIDNSFNFKKDNNKKLIYISLGNTFTRNVEFYQMCIEAFGNSKDYQVIMSIGKDVDKKELGDIPDNFYVLNYAPQLQILPQTDIFINHGGNNSINEAFFLNNLPILVIPQELTQDENVKAIEKYEAGLSLDKEEISAELLRESVDTYLADKEKYQKGIAKIVESFKEARNERKKIFEKIFV